MRRETPGGRSSRTGLSGGFPSVSGSEKRFRKDDDRGRGVVSEEVGLLLEVRPPSALDRFVSTSKNPLRKEGCLGAGGDETGFGEGPRSSLLEVAPVAFPSSQGSLDFIGKGEEGSEDSVYRDVRIERHEDCKFRKRGKLRVHPLLQLIKSDLPLASYSHIGKSEWRYRYEKKISQSS
jgi:hypothetical protein